MHASVLKNDKSERCALAISSVPQRPYSPGENIERRERRSGSESSNILSCGQDRSAMLDLGMKKSHRRRASMVVLEVERYGQTYRGSWERKYHFQRSLRRRRFDCNERTEETSVVGGKMFRWGGEDGFCAKVNRKLLQQETVGTACISKVQRKYRLFDGGFQHILQHHTSVPLCRYSSGHQFYRHRFSDQRCGNGCSQI